MPGAYGAESRVIPRDSTSFSIRRVETPSRWQVATLRAQLAGNLEEHKRLRRQLDRTADGRAYSTLVTSAFVEAVDRRFTKDTTKNAVIEFVADVRSRTQGVRDALDPRVAERLLLATIGDEDIGDPGLALA